MKRIILTTSLFFCLTITTVLAQVTPDGSTNTSTTDSGGVFLINIAAPVSGLSNNTYSDFNVSPSGVTLNNDVSNPNITLGNRASIIVNQVTSNNASLLEGVLQVAGYGAAIIIANPNGITCNGCYIGSSGHNVDLVTGTYDIATRTYDSISDNDITVGSGGLENGGTDLNIQTNNFTNSGLIYTTTVNLSLAGAFNNSGTIHVGKSFDASVDSFNITATDFTNSGTISVTDDNFNAIVDNFRNESGATINAPVGCNVVYTTSYADNGTSNCITSVGEVIVFNIARPVDGFSNNSVDDFSVNSYGTILNNSAGVGTAQLGDIVVAANSNITAGSEASLILFQVTGSSRSALSGTIEVFGSEAGLIIANPNGIACNVCAFINTNRVDLVTGSGYDAGTNTFGVIAATDITVGGSGVDAAELDVLNIQTGRDFRNNSATINTKNLNITVGADFFNEGVINTDNLNITAGNDFFNHSGTINADTITIEVTNFADDVSNTGTVSSASLNFILTDSFTHVRTSFSAFNNFSNLAITTDGTFTNNNAIDLAGNITITANTFINSNNVTAADNLRVVVSNHFNNSASTLKADNVDIQVTGYILNSANAMIEATDNLNIVTATLFNVAAGATVSNGDVGGNITAANLTIETGAFNNINNDGDINGNITTNTFNLSVAGAFDYIADYANNGTISNDALNLTVGGDFSYNDSASNFTWATNDNLAVLGNADITTNNYIQNGAIDVAGVLTITTNNFTYNSPNDDFVLAENDSLTVIGDADITTNNFASSGSITTDSLNITAGYTAINQGSIASNSLDITAHDFFRNLTGGDISVDSLNITAGGKVTNTANINVAGTLNILANNNSTRENDTTGFYVSNRGNITADNFVITAVDNFYNRGNITITSGFNTGARNIFFFNEEIDSFYAAGNEYDGGTITLGGDSSFIADGAIENYGNIDLGDNILDISADSFTNHADANVTADTLNLAVSSYINEGTINAEIVSDTTIDQ